MQKQSFSDFNVLRGQQFDFWGGVWVISELKDWFPGKIILAIKYLVRKFLPWKKYLSWRIVLEKNFYTIVCQEKILSPEVCEN